MDYSVGSAVRPAAHTPRTPARLTRSGGYVDDRGTCRIKGFPDAESGAYTGLGRGQQRDRSDERDLPGDASWSAGGPVARTFAWPTALLAKATEPKMTLSERVDGQLLVYTRDSGQTHGTMGCTLEYANNPNTSTQSEAVKVTTCILLPKRSNPRPMMGVRTMGMTWDRELVYPAVNRVVPLVTSTTCKSSVSTGQQGAGGLGLASARLEL